MALARGRRPVGPLLSAEDGADAAARAVLRFHLRTFAAEEAAARAGDVEGVHQLRVATRRLRAALRLFAPVLPAAFVESTRQDLTWVAGAIGAVRDLDVLGVAVDARAARLAAGMRKALGPLALALHERRAAAHAGLVAALDSARCRRLRLRLGTFAGARPAAGAARLGDIAPDLVHPLLRAVLRRGRRVSAASAAGALHRLRVRAKRLRYALETLRGLGGKKVEKLLRRLARLQEILGDCQDAVTGVAWLHGYAESAHVPPATLLAMGAMAQELTRRGRKRRRRLRALWGELARQKLARQVTAELSARRARGLEAAARTPPRSDAAAAS